MVGTGNWPERFWLSGRAKQLLTVRERHYFVAVSSTESLHPRHGITVADVYRSLIFKAEKAVWQTYAELKPISSTMLALQSCKSR